MPTEGNAEQLEFHAWGARRVVAAFDGGTVSSDAGALLLGRADEAIGLIDRLGQCFVAHRDPDLIEHTVRTRVGQRVFGLTLGYEDLNDHERLRHDPVFGALLGKLEPQRRSDCAAPAGKSTLHRLELHTLEGVDRYHKICPQTQAIERLWVQLTTTVGHTSTWRAGRRLVAKPRPKLKRGTVVATFKAQNRYDSKDRGNHAAFVVEYGTQDGQEGIVIYDQYREWPDKEQKVLQDLRAREQKLRPGPPDEASSKTVAQLKIEIATGQKALEKAYPEVDDKGASLS